MRLMRLGSRFRSWSFCGFPAAFSWRPGLSILGPMDSLSISSPDLDARIALLGAELRSLRLGNGAELLWSADPAFWAKTSPILFPVVGRTNNDEIRVDGRAYPMPQHGFAQRCRFEPLETGSSACRLATSDTPMTREHY